MLMNTSSTPSGFLLQQLKKLIYLTLLFSISSVSFVNAQTLVWQENFDAPAINSNRWTYDFGDGCERALCGWGNSEMQYYTSRTENVRVENGSLIIEARKENFQNSAFTSGRIKTEGRVHFKYGTVEARIKIPNVTNGLWPAFWTLGTVGPSWPSIGEIDMMEIGSAGALQAGLGNKRVSSAAHWSNAQGAHQYNVSYKDAAVDLSQDYHIYKMVWTSQYIKMYLDDVEYYTFDISGGTAANLSEFHNPHFLLLNMAVGGSYTNIFDVNNITAPVPGKMYVDYIKLYQNPGDELIIGNDQTVAGNFGVLTETTPVTKKLTYGTDADLYYWNNLTPITNPVPVPYEGSAVWAVHANAGDWFGLGISNNYVNLDGFNSGSLKMYFKTSYQGQFKLGIKTGHGETWLNFPASGTKYGMIRDGTWHEVTIPMADFNNPAMGMNIDLLSVKGALMFAGDPAISGADFYFDNIYFQRLAGTNAATPLSAAPTPPVRSALDVISLFSGAYAERSGTAWNPNWGQATIVTDTLIENNATKKYANLNYQGVDFSPAINATGMTKLHVDLWTANTNEIDFYLINPGPIEKKITLTPTLSGWNAYDIELTPGNFPGLDFSNIFQFKIVGRPEGGKVYLDNIYFYKVPAVVTTAPLTAAPTPPVRNAGDVLSLFSNAYTGVTGTDWFPNWGQSTVVSDTFIDGNTTKKYLNLNYQGVNFTPSVNAGTMQKLHLDLWTPNVTEFDLYLINPGPVEKKITLMPTLNGWNSFDIDLNATNFPGIDFSNIFQFKLEGRPSGGKVYLDNIYFWKSPNVVIGNAPTVLITSPANNAEFIAPANISITADAADVGGTITKVDFYNGATLLGTDNTSPYSYDWAAVASGNYTITAKATDNDGNTVVSTAVAIAVKPAACTGTAASGDYSYEVYTQGGIVYFTFKPLAPIAGSNLAIVYIKEGSGGFGGYGMTASGSNFTFSKAFANATPLTFYFTYNTPPGGERNSSADPHTYAVGSVCVPGAPTVAITSPLDNASFTAPASITINATAADANGTIAKVEFYNGATLLGMDDTSPYSYQWTNVPAGTYTLTANATDNSNLTTTSSKLHVAVNTPNLNGFCGTAVSGDYEYKAETNNGIVTFRLHPLTPIQGSLYAVINITAPNNINANMAKSGTDFVYSIPIANGTQTSFYFTYNTPPGGERNSSANRHSYTVGTNCLGISGSTPTISITFPANNASFTEPASITINANANDADGTVTNVKFYNGSTYISMDDTSPYTVDWTNVAAGNYTISAWATDNNGYTSISNLVPLVVNVNNTGGYCGTLANGDYSYKAESNNGEVTFTFHPLAPIAGCNNAIIYLRENNTGGYAGYTMTAIGSDFRFTKTIANGTPLSIYFTYNTPPSGERNSSATPHSYTAGTICAALLPVSLIQYGAFLNPNSSVSIRWTTTNEINNDRFIVEKSLDGIAYSPLAIVKAQGLSGAKKDYSTLDARPVKGINYYRLIQVDKDGRRVVYEVKTVQVINVKLIVRVFPNPLNTTRFYIQTNEFSAPAVSVHITDMAGKAIYNGIAVNAQGNYRVDLVKKPASGIYIVTFNGTEPLKLVVK